MFTTYKSKPIERLAHRVTVDDNIKPMAFMPSTSVILLDGKDVKFKHYEPVKVGDYIVYLKDTDVYHCSKEVFEERNIV